MSYDLPWKPYGNYVVSNRGQVFSRYKNKILKPRPDKDGYFRLELEKKELRIHRLVYGLFGIDWNPEMSIDHINQDKTDNYIENLRIATSQEQTWNAKRINKTGFTGVHINKNKFIARIRYNGKNLYLGAFDTAEEAHEAYKLKAKELHGDFMSSHLSI